MEPSQEPRKSQEPQRCGFIAATLLANMLTAPVIVWAAYVFGHIAEDRFQHRRHRHPA